MKLLLRLFKKPDTVHYEVLVNPKPRKGLVRILAIKNDKP